MDENIQPAEGILDLVEKPLYILDVAHVGFDDQGAAAQFLDLGGGLFSGCETDKRMRGALSANLLCRRQSVGERLQHGNLAAVRELVERLSADVKRISG